MKLITKHDLEQMHPWLVKGKPTFKATVEAVRKYYAEVVQDDKDQEALAHYREAAKERFLGDEGDIEVDDGAIISAGGDPGAYVQAWVWVSNEDAGVCTECGEHYEDGGDGYDGMCPSCADKAEVCRECDEPLTEDEYGNGICDSCAKEEEEEDAA